jgi:ABC-2 type transport system permease protein
MTRLIRAEVAKLATTRTFRLLAAGALILIAGAVTPTALATTYTGGSPARETLALAGLAQTFALIAGALAVTSEFRHKTIVPAVLITPRRGRVLAAKLVTLTGAGLVFGLAAFVIASAITMPVLASRHIDSGVDGAQLAAIIAGGAATTAIGAALGVGVGAVIRNQVGAIVTLLALLYVAEPLLGFIPQVGTAVQEYGIGGLATGATGTSGYPVTTHVLGQATAIAVLVGYSLAALLAGATLLRHRDIAA